VSSIYVGGQTENVFAFAFASAFVFAFRLPILYARQDTAVSAGELSTFVAAAGRSQSCSGFETFVMVFEHEWSMISLLDSGPNSSR
jgi:hypothetical protein